MELVADTLILHGASISDDDWVRYRELTQGKRLARVVLLNQSGGRVGAALAIADDLLGRGVTTIVAGYCRSACSYVFLAGERRQFAASWPLSRTYVAFHGAYDQSFGMLVPQRDRVAGYYRSRLPRASWDLVLGALDRLPDRRGFLYVYHPAHRDHASLCPGALEEKCERIATTDALSLGLITTRELAEVALPEKLAFRDLFLGVETGSLERIATAADLEKQCPANAARCRDAARRFLERPAERSLALSSSGRNGTSWQWSDARRAAWRALFECARQAGEPCRIVAVNGYLAAGLYARWEAQSAQATEMLRKLVLEQIPEERYAQPELRMSRLRTDTFSGPTPESIPGASEVGTREVVRLLAGAGEVVLVDVWCADRTLPGAKCIFGGGLAYSDRAMDQALEDLFLKLLDAVAGGRRAVLFSVSSENWLSANAALRAARSGRSVLWYRGGIEAWRRAGLPLVPSAPVGAVVH